MSEWQSMDTAPTDGDFYLYGLTVKHRSGHSWFEVYYLRWEDCGDMVEASGDTFSEWSHSDFEYWAAAPALPSEQREIIKECTFPHCSCDERCPTSTVSSKDCGGGE